MNIILSEIVLFCFNGADLSMTCRIADMRNKDVINITTGARLGYVCDVEVDTCTACLVAIIIYGRSKLFGFLGHEDDCVISWKDIEVIGEDTILVNCCHHKPSHRRCGFIDSLIGAK